MEITGAGAGPRGERSSLLIGTVPIQPGVTRVGWIGIGVMGAAMASRVRSAGYQLNVYARNPSSSNKALSSLLAAGAHLASSPADLARSSDVVFTMVGRPSDVRSLLLHPTSGVLSALPEGSAVVDTTSSDPELARQVASAAASRKCHAVDAPVSGGDVGAREGTLTVFAGCQNEEVIRWLTPLFLVMGSKVTHMGPPGSGQSAKIANQIAVSGSILGLTESLVFAETSGLDPEAFLDAIRGGGAGSKAVELFGERIIRRELGPGGFAEYLVKDLGMALHSHSAAAALPGTSLFQQFYLAMVASGDAKLGSHAIISVFDKINANKQQQQQQHHQHNE